MRLRSKIFLTSLLAIAVLFVVGVFSLAAIARLVAVNREIATRAVPAVRYASSTRDAVQALVRLEARFLVLADPRFLLLWQERADRAGEDLERLRQFLTTPREVELHREARDAYGRYTALVREAHGLLRQGHKARAQRLAETRARAEAEQVGRSLEELVEAAHIAAEASQTAAARLESQTWTGVLLALGLAVLLTLVGSALVADRLTRSLRRLSGATAAIAAGDFRPLLPARGRDEVAELARSFNSMAARLRELDELKEAFLATTSHELRSPLTSIREAAHLLRDGVPGPLTDKQARLVAIIGDSTERLLRLVNQILDLSRLRAGMASIAREPVDLARVVALAVEELRPQAEQAGVTLSAEQVGREFGSVGDQDRLVQVVVNLLSNAVRFTPAGGRVTARVVEAGGEIEVQVEDTGVGIPADVVPHLFEWYRQTAGRRSGSGLGLAIVRALVEAHGGRVTVESREGKGSRFTVLLPRGRGGG